MKIIQKLKNLWMMLRTKKSLINDFTQIQEELDNKLFDVMKDIEVLDPNKKYVLCAPEQDCSDLKALRTAFVEIQKSMKWTMPPIIIINHELRELKKKELENIIKKQFGS